MQSFISIVGAAALVSTALVSTACSHVPASESASQVDALMAANEAQLLPQVEPVLIPASAPATTRVAAQRRGAGLNETTEEVPAKPGSGDLRRDPQNTPSDVSARATRTADGIGYQIGPIAISRFLLARAVQNGEPIDAGDSFRPGERVYVYVQAANPTPEGAYFNVRWARAHGEPGEPFAINIGSSPRWRTWTSRNAPAQPGRYRCVIETVDGDLVASVPFDVRG